MCDFDCYQQLHMFFSMSCLCETLSLGSGTKTEKRLALGRKYLHLQWYVEGGRVGATQTLPAMLDAPHDMYGAAKEYWPTNDILNA